MMRWFPVSLRSLRSAVWICPLTILGAPASAHGLTLPVASSSTPPAADLLNNESRVWRLLNPANAAAADAQSAAPWGHSARPESGDGAGKAPDPGPLTPPNAPDPRPPLPTDGVQPSGEGCGASRPTGGDGPNVFGIFALPPNLEPASVGRLTGERMVLDLPKHAASVFRPPRPAAAS
jgi:hypothetical protein